jgi:hypothetical protein
MCTNVEKRASRILDIARRMAEQNQKQTGKYTLVNRIEEIQLHVGYSEPGYIQDALAATGNWNEINNTPDGDLPERIADLFEKMGIACEWSDEWTTCGDCGKLVRTQPDNYGWTPACWEINGDLVCIECVKDCPEVKQVDIPCKQCQKNVFSTDEACWWCGVNHPGL